jgi:hypothetical protein
LLHFGPFARLLFLFFYFPAGIQILFGLFAHAFRFTLRAFAHLVGYRVARDHFHLLAAIGARFGRDDHPSVGLTALVGFSHGRRGHEQERQ